MINPATLAFATMIGQLLLQGAIPLARQLVDIVHKPDPTLADWNTLLDSAESEARATLSVLAAHGIKPDVAVPPPAATPNPA